MYGPALRRRSFLAGTAVSALAVGAGPVAGREDGEKFVYEVTLTDAEWRERLTEEEFKILREGGTEFPESNPLWNHTGDGIYCCRGCDLTLYDSKWKVPVDKGWAFFAQSRENAILMGIDDPRPEEAMDDPNAPPPLIEAHCRRCGSHLGHILTVEGTTLHCINGTSMRFVPAAA